MIKQSTAGLKTLKAVLICLVFMLFIKIAYSQSPGNSSLRNPLAPIVLTVTGISAQAGIFSVAKLEWNPVDPLLAGDFNVERLENAVWNPIKKIRYTGGQTNYSFNDTISAPFCVNNPNPDYIISYLIRFVPDIGTSTLSNTASDGPFADITSPSDVINDTVSVYIDPTGTLTGRSVIGWLPSPSNDVAGYTIVRDTTLSLTYPKYDPIATVPAGTTHFIDPFVYPCKKSIAYGVITVDKCGKSSPGTYEYPVSKQTILLTNISLDPCERAIKFSWNAYNYMPGGLGGYKVYRKDKATPIFDSNGDTTKRLYTDRDKFISGQTYTYYVRPYSKNGLYSSTSCEMNKIYTGPSLPDSIYIMQASVEGDSCVKIDYLYKPDITVKNLRLERKDSLSGRWTAIDSTSITGIGNLTGHYGSFTDTTAEVHSQSYTYRLVAVDSCNTNPVVSFNTTTTILLQQAFSATDNVLVWNSYNTWLQGVKEYKIYRMVDGQPPGGALVPNSGSATDTTFYESTSKFDPKAQVCYWIEAYENTGNPYTVPLVIYSRSNMGCIVKDATLYMPNAFKPESDRNNKLRPVYTFVDQSGFRMIVFDRWGKEIFETTNLDGWDGRINGQIASPGLYSYLVTYRSFGGKENIKRGTASLIR